MSQSIQNSSSQNEFDRSAGALAEEKTLRLIAMLPAPEGLENRMKQGLSSAPGRARILAWPFSSPGAGRRIQSGGVRAAAAAAIVILIAGGGWGVYSHIQPAPVPSSAYGPLPPNGRGSFNAAGAKRVPQTLEGPVLVKPAIVKEKLENESTAGVSQKHGKRSAAKRSTGEKANTR